MTIGELKKLLETASPDTDLSELLPQKEVSVVIPEGRATDIPIIGQCCQMKHSVNIGDLIAGMGAMKTYYEITKRKVIVLQTINRLGQYYQGAVHPVTDAEGRQVTVNQVMFDLAKPLIESQEYIQAMESYTGQEVNIDLDVIRGKTFVNLPHGPIQGWIPLAYPDLAFDISEPWIFLKDECPAHIKGQVVGKVIINFTERYRMQNLDYYYLKNYSPDLIFAGTEKEHWLFCNQWGLTIPRLEIKDFLEYAYALKNCRFFMGNQSMGWGLCQAMGVRRLLEMCSFADNCFPGIGKNSLGYFYQVSSEYGFRRFYNETSSIK